MSNICPRIFIGSAKESLNIAKKVKEILDNDFECILWNEPEAFELNTGTLENLKNHALASDYAVFVGGDDDRVIRKGETVETFKPRDNVYLEWGLFAGIISPERTFLLIHKKCKFASDMLGITLEYYSDIQNIPDACKRFKNKILKEETRARIVLRPSTSLAIGYRDNFLERTRNPMKSESITLKTGQIIDVRDFQKELKIIIPDCVDEDWQEWAKKYGEKEKLVECKLESVYEGGIRGINVMLDSKELNNRKVVLIDVPQTMRVAFQAIELAMRKDYVGEDTEKIKRIKMKEVENFQKVIEAWILQKGVKKQYIIQKVHLD